MTAAPTLAALRPPARIMRPRRAILAASVQSTVTPAPLVGPSYKNTLGRLPVSSRPSRNTGQRSTSPGTSRVAKSPASVCNTSGRNPSSTACHSAFVGCRITATRRTVAGRSRLAALASAGVTRRGESANTKPTASAPAATAVSTSAADFSPQIFTNKLTMPGSRNHPHAANTRLPASRIARINAAGLPLRISAVPTNPSR